MVKKLLIPFALLLILIIGGLLFLYSSLDSLVLGAIEDYGTRATGTRVEVSSVSLSLIEGIGKVQGVRVANPEGFSDPYAFTLSEITLNVDPAGVTSSPYLVEQVLIHMPEVIFERRADGTSNFDIIRSNIEESRGDPAEAPADVEDTTREEPRFIIDEFTFEKGRATVKAPDVLKENFDLEIAQVRLNDIGGQEGATADEVGQIILGAFTQAVSNSVARQGINRVIEEKLDEKTGGAVKGIVDSIFK